MEPLKRDGLHPYQGDTMPEGPHPSAIESGRIAARVLNEISAEIDQDLCPG
jgi:hypothetical protein